MQHLQNLLNTYTVKTQHSSTAKNNYNKFNANAAYVKHMLAYKQLVQAYAQYAAVTNCATAFTMRFALNAAIVACNNKIKYATTHKNYCAATANTALQKQKRALRKQAA
jgi:hypothetical protein